jgi:LPXTG-site transpeptidase (sortase) family protein
MLLSRLRLIQAFFVCLLLLSLSVIGVTLLWPAPANAPVSQQISAAPVRLRIPHLSIDAPVLPVGSDAAGNMAIPERTDAVGWFAPGVFPGSSGSAVFAGHLNTRVSAHGIFWNLNTLQPGDAVYVDTASGQTLLFTVTSSQSYPYDQAPMQEIFGSSSGHLLNLITCNGVWEGQTYNRRLVVSTKLVENGK